MILMIVVGLITMAVGKLRLTRSLTLVGKKARWYGFTLFITAIPFTLIFGTLIALLTPESVLTNPIGRRVINFGLVAGYLLLLARPFRESVTSKIDKTPVAAGQ